jgi:hypothetical protein
MCVPVKRAAQNWQFLEKNFKQHLIMCLPGVKHAWKLKKVIPNYSNTR